MKLRPACRRVDLLLGEYAVGALGDESRRVVEAHVAICTTCREDVRLESLAVAGLRALREKDLPAPPDLRAGVWRKLSSELPSPIRRATRWWWVPALAAAAATAAVSLWVLSKRVSIEPTPEPGKTVIASTFPTETPLVLSPERSPVPHEPRGMPTVAIPIPTGNQVARSITVQIQRSELAQNVSPSPAHTKEENRSRDLPRSEAPPSGLRETSSEPPVVLSHSSQQTTHTSGTTAIAISSHPTSGDSDDVQASRTPTNLSTPEAPPHVIVRRSLFHPSRGEATVFSVRLDEPGSLRITIFDLRGNWVATLSDSTVPAGIQEIRWDGTSGKGGIAPVGEYRVAVAGPGWTERVRVGIVP